MASLNKCTLIGNLGSDPEVRHLEGGSVVARFNIATTERWTNKNGEKMEATEWHKIEVWENLAKLAEQYLKKGSQVYIEGKMKTESFTDKDGIERQVTRIRGFELKFLDKREQGSTAPATVDTTAKPQATANRQPAPAPAPNRRTQSPIPQSMAEEDPNDLPF